MVRRPWVLAGILLLAGCAAPATPPEEESLFDGKTLGSWKPVPFSLPGEVRVADAAIEVQDGDPLTGILRSDPDVPRVDYEIRLEAMKRRGHDIFCGIVFPVGEKHCSFIMGGWGGGVVGLSSVNGRFADENETRTIRSFEEGRWYRVRLRVTATHIEAWIDDGQVVNLKREGRRISSHPSVLAARPLGIFTYQTASSFRALRLVRLP
jgi:hypothetical protein